MKRSFICSLAILLLAAVAPAHPGTQTQESAKPSAVAAGAPAAKPIDAMRWVIGGVWTADASKMAPGMRIETRYQWSDNNAYIRFNTHFVFDKGTAKTYDGNFYWDPDGKHLAMWYMDAQNTITAGPLEVSGDQWVITFHGPDFEGKMADLRVTVKRKTNDDYLWSVAEKDGANWKELASLEYLRVAGQ